jgi:hypothetical protein
MTVIRQGPEVCLEVLIAHGQWLVITLISCDGLREGTQVLGPPGAVQRLGHLLLTMLAVGVAQLGQGEGGACASDEGTENGPPRDARQGTIQISGQHVK